MRNFVATALLLLVFSSSAFAQIEIKKEDRILNRNPGYCAWTCIETLGRHHQIKSLYNLVDNREKEFIWEWKDQKWVKSPYVWVDYGNYKAMEHRANGSYAAVTEKLSSLKIKYRSQSSYNYDRTLLKSAIANKQGCMVVVKWWLDKNGRPLADSADAHAIVILDYNKDGIRFFDPNDVDYMYTANHEWFSYYWTGYTLVIDK